MRTERRNEPFKAMRSITVHASASCGPPHRLVCPRDLRDDGVCFLIDGGEVHQGPEPVVLWYSAGDDEVLTLDGDGVFMALRWNGGGYQVSRAVDLNVTVNAARLDVDASLLAVGHADGALVLDIDTDQVTLEIDLPDPVDDVDWDDDGDVWVVHNGGLRQAIEHETGALRGANQCHERRHLLLADPR